jgi:hypothetical protein
LIESQYLDVMNGRQTQDVVKSVFECACPQVAAAA